MREIVINPDEDMESVKSDNSILFIGMGLFAIGLVTTFVGLGDKGFKTSELKLVGPCLAGCGIVLAAVRVLLCTARQSYTALIQNEDEEQSGNLCG